MPSGERYEVTLAFNPASLQQGAAAGGAALAQMAQVGVQANQLILQSSQAVSAQLTSQASAVQALVGVTASLVTQISAATSSLGAIRSASAELATSMTEVASVEAEAASGAAALAISVAETSAAMAESAGGAAGLSTGYAELVASIETVIIGGESLAEVSVTLTGGLEANVAAVESVTSSNLTAVDSYDALAASQSAVIETGASVAMAQEEATAGLAGLASATEAASAASESLVATGESVTATTESRVAASEALDAAQGALAASTEAMVSIQSELLSVQSESVAIAERLGVSQTEAESVMAPAAAGAAALAAATSELVAAQATAAGGASAMAAASTEVMAGTSAEIASTTGLAGVLERLAMARDAALAAADGSMAATSGAAAVDAVGAESAQAAAVANEALASSTIAAAAAEAARVTSAEAAGAATASLEAKLTSLVHTVDAEAAAEAQLTAAEHLLDEAVQAGLISLERQNELLELAREKFVATGEAAEGVGSKVGEMAEMVKGLAEVLLVFEAVDFFKESVGSAENYAVALRQIDASIAATGGTAHVTSGELQEIAEKLEETTNYSRTAALGMENLLLNFKAINGENFGRVSQDVADLATKMRTDLSAAATQLGRALENPTSGLTALRRAGIVFSDAQKEQIKTMVDAGNQAGALSIILTGLESKVGGQAAAARDAGTGMASLKNTLEAIQETIGSAMIPAVRSITTEMAEWLKVNHDSAAELGQELGGAVKATGELLMALAKNIDAVKVAFIGFASIKAASTIAGLVTSLGGLFTAAEAGAAASTLLKGSLMALEGGLATTAAVAIGLGAVLAPLAVSMYAYTQSTNEAWQAEQKQVSLSGDVHSFLLTTQTQTTALTKAQYDLALGYIKAAVESENSAERQMKAAQDALAAAKAQGVGGLLGGGVGGGATSATEQALTQRIASLRAKVAEDQRIEWDIQRRIAALGHDDGGPGGDHPSAKASKGAAKLAETVADLVAKYEQVTASQQAEQAAIGLSPAAYNAAAVAAAGQKAETDLLIKAAHDHTTASEEERASVMQAAEDALRATQANKAAQVVAAERVALDNQRAQSLAKVTDALNQTNSASIMASAIAAGEAKIESSKLTGRDAQDTRDLARAKGEDQVATAARDATIKAGIQFSVDLRTAQAALLDVETQSTVASFGLSEQLKAEAAARLQTGQSSGAEYQAALQRNLLRQQELVTVTNITTELRTLNTVLDQGAKLTAQAADMQLLSSVTSQYGDSVAKILQQYGQLDTASHQLQVDDQVRTALQTAHTTANTTLGQSIESLIRNEDAYTQGLKAQQAVLAANIQIQRDWDSAVTASRQQWQSSLINMIETGKADWQTFVKNIEDIWLKALFQMAADGRAADLVSSLTGGTINLGNNAAANLASQQASLQQAATQQLQAAAETLQTAGTQLTAASDSLTSTSTSLSSAITSSTSSQTTAIDAAGQSSATWIAQAASQLMAAAAALQGAASALASGGGGFGGLGNFFGGGGPAAGAGSDAMAGLAFDNSVSVAGPSVIDLTSTGATAGTAMGTSAATSLGSAVPIIGAMIGVAIVANMLDSWLNNKVGYSGADDIMFGVSSGTLQSPYGKTLSYSPPGAAYGTTQGAAGQDQQIAQQMQQYFEAIQTATGALLTQLPDLAIKIRSDGKQYEASIGGQVIGTYSAIGDAVNAAIVAGLKQAGWQNLPGVVQRYISQAANVGQSSQTILTGVQTIEAAQKYGQALSAVQKTMEDDWTAATNLEQSLTTLCLSASDLSPLIASVNAGLLSQYQQERDSVLGIQLTAKQKFELDVQQYNAELAMKESEVKANEIQLQTQALALEGQGAYITGIGDVARASVIGAEAQAKSAALSSSANQTLLAEINAQIDADNKLIASLQNLTITAADAAKAPAAHSAGTSSFASTLQNLKQLIDQVRQSVHEIGMDAYAKALDQINIKWNAEILLLGHDKKAIDQANAARQQEIDLLNLQTKLSIGQQMKPYEQEMMGMSSWQQQMADLHNTWTQAYNDAVAAGASARFLGRILDAEGQAMKDLGQQVVQSLNLPLETAAQNMKKVGDAIAFITQNAATLGFTAQQVSQIVQETAQQITIQIATGLSQYVTDAADKQRLDQMKYELDIAQLKEQLVLAEDMHLITTADASWLQDMINKLPATAPAASTVSTAQTSLASSATNAADALKVFAQSLRQNAQLTALTPQQRLDAAKAYFDATTAKAQTGDQTALQNEQQAAQDYLSALRGEFGSSGPYSSIFAQVLQTLADLGNRFGTGSPASLPVNYGFPPWMYPPGSPQNPTSLPPPGSGALPPPGSTNNGSPGPPPDPNAATQAATAAMTALAAAATQAATAMGAMASALHAAHVPGFAEGGLVLNRQLAWVGEAGPEAIIPLRSGSIPVQISSRDRTDSTDSADLLAEFRAYRAQQQAEAAEARDQRDQLARQQADLNRQLASMRSTGRAGRVAAR